MGYILSSLAELSINDEVDLYIFVVNGGWKGGNDQLIKDNFERIAEEIGSKAVIAKGFNKNEKKWTSEIANKYLGKDYRELSKFLPALLITDSHPNNLTEESMRLLVPLNKIEEKFGDIDSFLNLLTRFAKDRDEEFLELFEKKESMGESISNMFELKPNVAGIGVNLNAIIERYYKNK